MYVCRGLVNFNTFCLPVTSHMHAVQSIKKRVTLHDSKQLQQATTPGELNLYHLNLMQLQLSVATTVR
jgi:hypothetical protein